MTGASAAQSQSFRSASAIDVDLPQRQQPVGVAVAAEATRRPAAAASRCQAGRSSPNISGLVQDNSASAERRAGPAARRAAERAAETGGPAGGADPALAGDALVDHAQDRGRRRPAAPISVPNTGRPVMKARVPSIGSSTQRSRACGLSQPELLAENAVLGKALRQHRAHRLLGGAVGDGHRAAVALEVGREPGAEQRADDRAGDVGRGLGGADQRSIGGRCIGVTSQMLQGMAGGNPRCVRVGYYLR